MGEDDDDVVHLGRESALARKKGPELWFRWLVSVATAVEIQLRRGGVKKQSCGKMKWLDFPTGHVCDSSVDLIECVPAFSGRLVASQRVGN